MLQHLLVTLIFAACLYVVVRRVVRIISSAKRGESRCDTCTEVSCPLRDAARAKKCGCSRGCNSGEK